jgi:AAHS family 4-hydroxybenzoate transporter-like MFS transporter
MVAKGQPVERIRRVLRCVSSAAADATAFVMADTAPATAAKSGAAVVLSSAYLVGSLMLWLAYFMGLVIFYALINWMPILFKDAGVDARNAALISALFPLGGVGAIFFGWLMDRFNGNTIIAAGFVLVAGTLMNTAQSSLPALAAGFYPTQGRATGVSWMLGLGRFGGIAGSFLVAELTRRQLTFSGIFSVVAIPGLIAAAALTIKQIVHPEERSERALEGSEVLGH